jgi:hypothetical protein
VNDPVNGAIVRVDPTTGAAATYADCLPAQIPGVGLGGGMDVAFSGNTAYALVSVVSDPLFGPGGPPDGIYRIDGPHNCTLVADIGAWSIAHPPCCFDFFLKTGVQYAMQAWRGGFLVTDGHHNRVLRVGLDGSISEVKTFGDVVPTGLEVQGDTVYLAEAGAIVGGGEENGKIVAIDAKSAAASDVAAGGALLVDVERGRGQTMFGLAQGTHSNTNPGTPAAIVQSSAVPPSVASLRIRRSARSSIARSIIALTSRSSVSKREQRFRHSDFSRRRGARSETMSLHSDWRVIGGSSSRTGNQ